MLVVTSIDDEYDEELWAKPAEWYQAVVVAKGGDPNAVADGGQGLQSGATRSLRHRFPDSGEGSATGARGGRRW
ncbi:hypothetical protein OV203_11460 [Nannocystis sp. ILAH1]|uniref:hypothetical protein n=1 Tax=unclassified Nannocystis TaxID=2627009 RepID=UPI00226E452E|nr:MULTISPECIES: hypothetical protein [unclassified Nannocystis]MCY0987746.1 hypothetical protein [Nannocystis sp. ILAH1]MCY1070453.1 hypothetical protein [Nannocystis sp. RBIL2]